MGFAFASRPTRARGLKPLYNWLKKLIGGVAPHAGAWIETPDEIEQARRELRRAPRGRVD